MAASGVVRSSSSSKFWVKNMSEAAVVQISAEHIIREALERSDDVVSVPDDHKLKINDSSELADYRLAKRKRFEDEVVRRGRWNKGAWTKYANWEESQKELNRARSVWERALEKTNYRDHSIWLKYADFEMRNKFINRARNVWERAVMLLPRIDQLWYKYLHMEEMLGNVAAARRIFERWTSDWEPVDHSAWICYIKFELRYKEIERSLSIIERARTVLKGEQLQLFEDDIVVPPKQQQQQEEDNNATTIVEDNNATAIVVKRRRIQYEDEVIKNPLNYDSWFDYIRLEETLGNKETIREVYERAIANVPPALEKRYWHRYIYLWINYAMFQELDAQDIQGTRDVYLRCLNLIPHHIFSFAKIWLLAARFEVRQLNLKGARLILGSAIGKAPKDKIFNKYVEIERQLGNVDRCRKLYHKYLEWSPSSCRAWIKYAEFETFLDEAERARCIFELAVAQPALDLPELLSKAFIDFEISCGESERARQLYQRLLDKTRACNYSKFEEGVPKILEAARKWKKQKIASGAALAV